ncbi:MAG TPA: hypothetical protein VFW45_11600 [Candidatus Polarisedimenticolia bacterium]|nr:hypothetical protein [Candidatus Polarisedimenticolia bacterium]
MPLSPRRLAARSLVGLLLALVPGAAFPFGKNKINYDNFDWHIYKSPHFDVYYYPEEEGRLEQVVSFAESAYVKLSQDLDHEVKIRIPLIFYKTHGEFEQTNVQLDFIPEYVAAFAEPFENRMVLPVDRPPDLLYELITHELVHIFEFSIFYEGSIGRALRSNTPPWLMEGLAEHLANASSPLNEMVIRDAVVHNIIPPIHRVNVVNFLTYRFGQAAFDYIGEKYGLEGIRNFLWEYRKVLLSNNLDKPIREAFGVEPDEFDRQFRRYLEHKYLPLYLDKKEPEDYGHEIGFKNEGIYTFSPTLSPSGDLVASLTTRYEDLDVVVFSTKDGTNLRNITKGFTNKYQYIVTGAFDGKNDLTWSPEGDRIAFFARREDERNLFVYDALKGKLLQEVVIPGVEVEESPAFSPDGKSVIFSGNVAGVVDIFRYDFDTKKVSKVTDDEYYDANPAWSPDGKTIVFNRRIDRYVKIFMVDASDPGKLTQLTFGESSDIQPSFSKDGKTLYYSSDLAGHQIYNLYSLSLVDGEIRQYTDLIGSGFNPLEIDSQDGKATLAFTGYDKGRFHLYRMELNEPVAVIKPSEQTQEPPEIEPFEPPLKLTLDEKEKGRYDKLKWHVESSPSVLIGVANDGTILTNAQLVLSDLLGDHRVFMNFQSVSTYSNIDLQYWNLKHRWQYGYRAMDFRDYYLLGTSSGGVQRQQATRTTGISTQVSYPLSVYYRIEASIGAYQRSLSRPVSELEDINGITVQTVSFETFKDNLAFLTTTFSGDTTRYKDFGPYHGKRFGFTIAYAPFVVGDGSPFAEYYVDYRAYGKLTSRSLFAWRFATAISNSTGFLGQDGSTIYSFGGYNTLRGYEFREFFGNRIAYSNLELRFPLVDELRFPFGGIHALRGFIFLDVGAGWFQGPRYFDPNTGRDVNYQGVDLLLERPDGTVTAIPREFNCWDEKNDRLGDCRAAWGLGFAWYLGPFELTWVWAKRFENSALIPIDTGGSPLIANEYEWQKDPTFDSSLQTSFYIGRSF